MFEYESEILTALRDSEDDSLLERVKSCRDLFDAYQNVKVMCNEQICRIFVIVSGILLLLGIFSIQMRISPIGLGFLTFGGIGMLCSIVLFFVYKVDVDNWLDFLMIDDVERLNKIIVKENIEIVDKEEIVYLKRKKRVVKCIE